MVVGPNGSGKSNITDAVLWALGEQSPLAVRGQTMKDVIFAGGHGVKGSAAAEVEVVIDNSAGRLDSDFGEISIVRRLDRSGEGEYRLNGARCRLADVVEVLSDTGLGKEMHSVVSQGRVESIVLSRPRERRLLIEEAAGLGKHRKRRRRAQLKLERTEENLSRALDVEREARSRLRPLKRQAEAAQLHERLERQTHEARYELAREDVRVIRVTARRGGVRGRLGAGAEGPRRVRAGRRGAVVGRPPRQAFAALTREREELQARSYAARSAARAHRPARRACARPGARRRRGRAPPPRTARAAGVPAGGPRSDPGEAGGRPASPRSRPSCERLDAARDERVRDALAELEQRAGGRRGATRVAGPGRRALQGGAGGRRARRRHGARASCARPSAWPSRRAQPPLGSAPSSRP